MREYIVHFVETKKILIALSAFMLSFLNEIDSLILQYNFMLF